MSQQGDFAEFGAAQFLRRKNASSIKLPKDQSVAKSKNLKKPKAGGEINLAYFPGDYEILKCELHSSHLDQGAHIDLRSTFSSLNIYEDMFSPSLQMDITIADGTGLAEFLPIIGEESIYLQIRTANLPDQTEVDTHALEGADATASEGPPPPPGPFVDSENTGMISLSFSIYKMSDKVALDNVEGVIRYTLHGVSREYIDSCKQKVQRSTIDERTFEPRKISNAVRYLYNQYFKWSPKKIFIEPTKNLSKIITPNLNPFQTFEFLAARAVSAGVHAVGSNFVFFETTTGFHFVSIETLMAGGGKGYINPPDNPVGTSPQEGQYSILPERSKETYTVFPKRIMNPENDSWEHQAGMDAISMDAYSFSSNFDVLENLTKGMYANKLLTHDIVRMKTDFVDFNYIKPTDQKVQTIINPDGSEEQKPKIMSAQDKKDFDDTFTHLDEGDLCTWHQHALGSPEAHINFYPTSLGHDSIPHFKNGIGTKTVKHGAKIGPLNIVPNRVEQWMQQGTAQEQQLNNIKVNVRAPGRSCRMVGDIVNLKFPSQMKKGRGSVPNPTPHPEHPYLSGKYLITKLKHNFTQEKYTIDFEAIKDSLKEQMSGTVDGSSAIQDDGTIKMSEDGTRVIGGF